MAPQPYNFEPTVNDLEIDIQPQYLNNSFLEIDVNGRSKVTNINNWCMCEKCCILNNDVECVCCAEFEKVTPLQSGNKCITESDLFKKIILDEDILNITSYQIILKTNYIVCQFYQIVHGGSFVTHNIFIGLICGLHWVNYYYL